MANGADPHICPQCGKFKFMFQEVCYDCRPEQNNNTSRRKSGYAYNVSYQELTYRYKAAPEEQKTATAQQSQPKDSFHQKYDHNNKFKCECGIYVKSQGERTVADFLYKNNIPFEYETEGAYWEYDLRWNNPKYKSIHPDFFIKGPVTFHGRRIEKVYIEYWGMDTPEYLEKQAYKYNVYKRHNCTLINLYPEDLYDCESSLTSKLTGFKDRQINY